MTAVTPQDIIKILPDPTLGRRGQLKYPISLPGCDIRKVK
jgi:hypothetical protein